jgi:hypothetical protein
LSVPRKVVPGAVLQAAKLKYSSTTAFATGASEQAARAA